MVVVNYKYYKEFKYGWILSGFFIRNDVIGVVIFNIIY